MKLKCIEKIQDFTIGEEYNLLGCAGEYIVLKADDGKRYTVFEGYFEIVKYRRGL